MLTRFASIGCAAALIGLPQPVLAQAPANITITVTNARAVKATSIEVVLGTEVVARHTKALAPGAKATIRLRKLKDCLVAINATFEDGSDVSADGQDVCADKTMRLVD